MTRIARLLRIFADRIDPDGAFRSTGWSVWIGHEAEPHIDRFGREGALVWYLGREGYEKLWYPDG